MLTTVPANSTSAFCVWATKQNFLHGKFVWCNWEATRVKRTCNPQNSCVLKLGLQGTATDFKELLNEAPEDSAL